MQHIAIICVLVPLIFRFGGSLKSTLKYKHRMAIFVQIDCLIINNRMNHNKQNCSIKSINLPHAIRTHADKQTNDFTLILYMYRALPSTSLTIALRLVFLGIPLCIYDDLIGIRSNKNKCCKYIYIFFFLFHLLFLRLIVHLGTDRTPSTDNFMCHRCLIYKRTRNNIFFLVL